MAGVFFLREGDKKKKRIRWKQNIGLGPRTSGAKRPKEG